MMRIYDSIKLFGDSRILEKNNCAIFTQKSYNARLLKNYSNLTAIFAHRIGGIARLRNYKILWIYGFYGI
ncbi:hypothetical protein ACRE1S_00695 [Helicobacter himalayensis]|uniref:hypothetical protein n=1 Tax=Helicobacter himalayensis TaxID=1591088 RepID=UPI003D6FE9DE